MRVLALCVGLLCCVAELPEGSEKEKACCPVFSVDDVGGVGRVFDGIGAISGGGVSAWESKEGDREGLL